MKNKGLLLSVLVLLSTAAFASQKRKVLFIGIDGVRSDALQVANTPNIDTLIAHGAYTYDSWCLGITVSGPSWSTIFTGVWYQKHGVTDNSYSGSHFDQFNMFPKLAKNYKPSLYASEVMEWPPLIDNVPNQYDGYDVRIKVPDGGTSPTGTTTATQLLNSNLDVMTVYYDAVDLQGHSNGFSPTNPSYLSAIHNVDSSIGVVIAALKNRPNYAKEDWLILLTTDHGGTGTGHGGNTDQERHIWWVANGTNIKHKQLFGADPGSYRVVPPGVDTNILKTTPVQADIAVTALHHLLGDTISDYKTLVTRFNLDGKSLLDSIYQKPVVTPSAVNTANREEVSIKLYPNPSTGLFTFWIDGTGKAVSYAVLNLAGGIVKQEQPASGVKVNVDLSDQPNGMYIVRFHVGDQLLDRKVVLAH